jgi:hypothetical protein
MGEWRNWQTRRNETPGNQLALDTLEYQTLYVKLMADYCSDGIWSESGSMMTLEELPISEQLLTDIHQWTIDYEASQFYLSPHERTRDFDTQAFNARGAQLAQRLSVELKSWRVEFRPE